MNCFGREQKIDISDGKIQQCFGSKTQGYQYIYQYSRVVALQYTINNFQKFNQQFNRSCKLIKPQPKYPNKIAQQNASRLLIAQNVTRQMEFINHWNTNLTQKLIMMTNDLKQKQQGLANQRKQMNKFFQDRKILKQFDLESKDYQSLISQQLRRDTEKITIKQNQPFNNHQTIKLSQNTTDQLKNTIQQKQNIIQQLKDKLQAQELQYNKITQQLLKQRQQYKKNVIQKDKQYNTIINNLKQLQQDKNQLVMMVEIKEKFIQQLNQKITKIQDDNYHIKQANIIIQNQNLQLKQEINNYKIKIQDNERDTTILKQQCQKKINQLEKKNNQMVNTADTIYKIETVDSIVLRVLPGCKALNNLPTDLQVNYRYIISQFFEDKIQSTKLIYAYDPVCQNHFNDYIKGKSNLFLIGKTEKGVIFGGFTKKSFESRESNPGCFIFSIGKNKQPIILRANNMENCVSNNDNFLIFGSSQIRIRAKSTELFSLVGTQLCHYKPTKYPVSYQDFLDSETREVKMECYQIYSLSWNMQ